MSFGGIDLLQSGILIVDDEPVNAAVLEAVLEDEKFENVRSTTEPPGGRFSSR